MNDVQPVVCAEGVSKRFVGADGKPMTAVDAISLTARPGELTALVGPDGAGKTTLLRMVAGLLAPDEGRLTVLGFDVAANPQAVQDRISYMPQRFGLYEDLSVQENMDLYADLHGVAVAERRVRFPRLLRMMDMDRFTARPAGKLSGGMKQKLGLICTLVRSPELLLLDEPSVGVDPLSRRDLWRIVLQLVQQERLSVVVSTAYMDEAERCTQVHVMFDGKVLGEGSPEALAAYAQGLCHMAVPHAAQPARNLQARLIDAASLIVDAVPHGGNVRFVRQPGSKLATVTALLDDARCVDRPAGLEDAFMLMLHGHQAEQVGAESGVPVHASVASDHAGLIPDAGGACTSGDEAAWAGRVRPVIMTRAAEAAQEAARPDDVGVQTPVIEVKDLVRRFGDFTAVASTSFSVQRGEIFGLLGPNGAGKTTTFRMLCGLLPASGGFLQVAGHNLRSARSAARARIGYVAQKFSLYGNLSVQENLEFYGAAYGLRGRRLRDRVRAMIARFGLAPDATSGMLPAGYRQRLAMAVGLLHEPDILFLDEPTSGIDPLARRAFWRTITDLAQDGVTIVVTTHFMEEAEYCDRIAIQDAGSLLALGTPAQVRRQAGGRDDLDMNSAFIAIVEQGRQA